jgi:hypothetical protein
VGPGGSLGLEVGTHVRQQIELKGGVFYMELVARVTRLGYVIRPKMAKRGSFFKISLEKGTFLKLLAKIT